MCRRQTQNVYVRQTQIVCFCRFRPPTSSERPGHMWVQKEAEWFGPLNNVNSTQSYCSQKIGWNAITGMTLKKESHCNIGVHHLYFSRRCFRITIQNGRVLTGGIFERNRFESAWQHLKTFMHFRTHSHNPWRTVQCQYPRLVRFQKDAGPLNAFMHVERIHTFHGELCNVSIPHVKVFKKMLGRCRPRWLFCDGRTAWS